MANNLTPLKCERRRRKIAAKLHADQSKLRSSTQRSISAAQDHTKTASSTRSRIRVGSGSFPDGHCEVGNCLQLSCACTAGSAAGQQSIKSCCAFSAAGLSRSSGRNDETIRSRCHVIRHINYHGAILRSPGAGPKRQAALSSTGKESKDPDVVLLLDRLRSAQIRAQHAGLTLFEMPSAMLRHERQGSHE